MRVAAGAARAQDANEPMNRRPRKNNVYQLFVARDRATVLAGVAWQGEGAPT